MAQDNQQETESNLKLITIVLYVYNGFLLFAGLGCLGVGIWMYADKNVYAYLYVMRRTPDDDTMIAAPAIIMTAGIIIIGVFCLGCFGVLKRNYCSMACYTSLLLLIMLLELTAGFIVVAFKHDIHREMKEGMQATLTDHYKWDNEYGLAWNRVQVRKRCCAVDGSWDYHYSKWWYGENGGAELELSLAINVPDSCCKLEPNQDRDVGRVDPQNPTPKDRQKCNEDSAGNRDGSEYLNDRGCFVALLDFIYVHMDLLIGLGLAVGFLQLIGLVCAILECYFLRQEKEMI